MIAATVVTVVRNIAQPLKKNILLFSEDFWGEQFDTFDNRCDVLRAAFCNSRDVFLERLRDFWVERLRDVFVWRGCVIFSLTHKGA